MKTTILTATNGIAFSVEICDTFFKKFTGLMMRKELVKQMGLIFIYSKESIINTSIHMLFMRFPITVVWLDKNDIVVDKSIALPWHLYYAASKPACKIIEIGVQYIDDFKIGDKISFSYEK
jgi:uncharacterized protein